MAEKNEWDVSVLTTVDNWEHALIDPRFDNLDSLTTLLGADNEPFEQFVNRVETASCDLDILWTVTPLGNREIRPALFDFTPQCPALTFAHEGGTFRPAPQLLSTGASAVLDHADTLPQSIRNLLWNHVAPRLAGSKFISNYDRIVALYPPVAEYIERILNKPVSWLLPEYHIPTSVQSPDRPFRITIPGTVSEDLRDYRTAFNTIEMLPRGEVVVDLLGPLKVDQRFRRRIENLTNAGYEIHTSESFISESEFARRLKMADLLFAPVNVSTGLFDQNKKGKTQTTGAVGDAVRCGTPLLITEEFGVADEFTGLLYPYSNTIDAAQFIKHLIDRDQPDVFARAAKTARQFRLKKQADRMAALCQTVLDE